METPHPDPTAISGASGSDASLSRAQGMLARPLPPDELEANTNLVGLPIETVAANLRSIMVFALGGELLALDAEQTHRVVPASVIRRVPHRSGEVFLGIANVAGEITPVCDLARALGLQAAAASDQAATHFVVLGEGGARWAFPVDRVDGVRRVDADAIIEPPATVRHSMSGCTEALVPVDGADDAGDPARAGAAAVGEGSSRLAALLDAGRVARLLARSLP